MQNTINTDIYRQSIVDAILNSYLNGEKTPDLDKKIQEWIVNGQDKAEKDRALKMAWDRIVRESHPDKEAYRTLVDLRRRLGLEQVPVRSYILLRPAFTRVAAVLVIGLLAGAAWFFASKNKGGEETSMLASAEPVSEPVIINAGDRGVVDVTLPDGSRVWVHRGGSITYAEDFTTDRTVQLEGEAFFDVTKHDGMPFVVKNDDISVRVLGTEFLVQAGASFSKSIVEVASGSVEVSAQDNVLVLQANDRLVYEDFSNEFKLTSIAAGEVVAPWKSIDLVFENNSLGRVFKEIASFYGVKIDIDDRLSLKERITVSFSEDESLEEVLYVIENTLRTFDFKIDANKVTIAVN